MAGAALILFAAVIVAIVFLVWRLARRRQPVVLPARMVPVLVAARRRALVAVAFAAVVFIAAAVAGVSFPSLLGTPLAVASLVAAAAGLLLYAATPPRAAQVEADGPRSAGLARRSWFTVIPVGWRHAFAGITVLFIAIIVFCGSTAVDDDLGRARAIGFASADRSSTASPYPGWFYGVPALIALVVLVAATIIALQRIGSTPAFPHPEDIDTDTQWRRSSASVVLSLATGAVLFTAGGFGLLGGQAMSRALIEGATPALWTVIAYSLSILGILFLVLGIVCVTLAALTALTIGERLVAEPEPAR